MSLNDTARSLVERPLNSYNFVTIYCGGYGDASRLIFYKTYFYKIY